jgi:hypothetical protein
MFSDLRVAMTTDVGIVKTLAETNTSSIAGAEARLSSAIEQLNGRFDDLTERMDRLFSQLASRID